MTLVDENNFIRSLTTFLVSENIMPISRQFSIFFYVGTQALKASKILRNSEDLKAPTCVLGENFLRSSVYGPGNFSNVAFLPILFRIDFSKYSNVPKLSGSKTLQFSASASEDILSVI